MKYFLTIGLLLFGLVLSARAEDLAFYQQELNRFKVDLALACANDKVSSVREQNAMAAVARVDNRWNGLKNKLTEINRFLDNPKSVLLAQVSRDLASLRDRRSEIEEQIYANAVNKISDGKISIRKFDDQVHNLERVQESLIGNNIGSMDSSSAKWVSSNVEKVQKQLAEYAELSQQYEATYNRVWGCLGSSGTVGTRGRTAVPVDYGYIASSEEGTVVSGLSDASVESAKGAPASPEVPSGAGPGGAPSQR